MKTKDIKVVIIGKRGTIVKTFNLTQAATKEKDGAITLHLKG